jgi:antitoxin component YwqK of YwqJK toxin-antitoxin module
MKSIIFLFFFNTLFSLAQTDFNKLDNNGKKHGVWKGLYPESKRVRYEGTFEHGKEVGIFNYYDDTKAQSIIATREFTAKDNSVYTIFYDQRKNKVSEGKQVNKLFEGQWKYYHQNSKEVMTIENYKNGKLEGLRTVFYPSTKIAEETNYSNGLKNGLYKKYSEKDAVVLEESNYKNGEYDGLAIYRDPLGNIVAQGKYVNGKKKGIWQFYENGKLVSEENMSKVKKVVKPKTK